MIRACRSPPARNGHCVSLSRTLAGRTGGPPRSRVRGLTRSFRSGRYRTASCRMIAPGSARGCMPARRGSSTLRGKRAVTSFWSFTGPTPAGFWIRRMAHETLVHRADAQLAAGAEPEPVIEAEIAADAIDEWLMLVTGGPGAGRMRPDRPAPITISARSSRIRKPRTGHHTDCGGDAPAAGPPGVRMGSRSSQVSDTGGRTAHQGRIAAARRDPGWPAGPGVLRPTVKDLRAW